MFYVYMYCDPISKQPLYIGKGFGNRLNHHWSCVKNNRSSGNKHFTNKLRKYLAEGLEPIIEIIQDGLSEEEALDLEKMLIEQYGRKVYDENGCLYNIREGGEKGNTGYEHTLATKEKLSLESKSRKRKPTSQITKDKIGTANSKKIRTEENKILISNSIKNKFKNDIEYKGKHKSSKQNDLKNSSKIWTIKNVETDEIFQVLNLYKFCKEQNITEVSNTWRRLKASLKNNKPIPPHKEFGNHILLKVENKSETNNDINIFLTTP